MHPKIERIRCFRDEMKTLGKLDGVCVVIDDKVATNRDDDAVRLDGQRWLAIACDDLVLYLLEREFLPCSKERAVCNAIWSV